MPTRETVEIGGVTYHLSRYDAFTALKVLGDLQKQFIAPLLGVLDGKEAGSPQAINVGIVQGVERVLRDMDGDKLVATAKRLLFAENIVAVRPGEEPVKLHERNWQMIIFDVADLVELCVEVVLTNYKSFFLRLASRIGADLTIQPTQQPTGLPAGSPLN